MNRVSKKVFDQVVFVGVPAYTSLDDVEALAGGIRMAVFAVVDDTSGGRFTVAIEHSADGKVFTQKNAVPEIGSAVLSPTGATSLYGYEAAPAKPSLKYVRLRVDLEVGTSAHAVVTVSVRGSPVRKERPPPPPRDLLRFAPAGSQERTVAMTRDFTSLAQEAKHLAPAQRAAHVLENLSPESREHLRELDRRILATPPEIRRKVIDATAQFMRMAVELSRKSHPTEAPSVGGCCDGPPKPCAGGC